MVRDSTVTKLVVTLMVATHGLFGSEAMTPDDQTDLTRQSGDAEDKADCAEWNTNGYFYFRDPEDVEACVAAGADLDVRDELGRTLLHRAAAANELPAVTQALLAAGGDLNARDRSGETPLHWAAAHNENAAVTQALLTTGADPNAQDESGSTPLHSAGFNNNVAVLHALLEAGADPNAKNDDGWSPVHCAASSEKADALLALVAAGADPKARTKKDEIPLHLASYAGTGHVLLLLGNDVKARNVAGRTALHFAAESADEAELIGVLVAAGADIGARDAWGEAPVHRFAWRIALLENVAAPDLILKALIANGADINAQDRAGDTPLHHAAHFAHAGPVIRALLNAGADGLVPNAKQQTPWDIARSNDDLGKRDGDAYWRLHEARLEAASPEP